MCASRSLFSLSSRRAPPVEILLKSLREERISTWHPLRRTRRRGQRISTKRVVEELGALSEGNVMSKESVTSEHSEEDTRQCKYVGKKAVVIGAGPAGATAAAFLAKNGFAVKVYEGRSDPLKHAYSLKRVNGIRLTSNTVNVMREAGVDLPIDGHRNGVQRHKGTSVISSAGVRTISYPNSPDSSAYVGLRNQFAEIISEDVQKKHGDRVAFFYNHRCTEVLFDEKQLTIEDSDGNIVKEGYDLLIAADGVNSIVRQKLQEYDHTYGVESFAHSNVYSVIHDLSCLADEKEFMKATKPGMITLVDRTLLRYREDGKPALSFIIILYPPSETNTVTVNMTSTQKAFDSIKDKEYEFVEQCFPPYLPKQWLREFSLRLANAPQAKLPTIHAVSRLYGPSMILVGDAGHSATNFMGLGANAAITDSAVLDDALDRADGDLDAVGKIFNDLRFEDVRALQDMQMTLDYKAYTVPFYKNWRGFVGWVHLSVLGSLRKLLPKLMPPDMISIAARGQCTPRQGMQKLKRDAAVFSMVSAVALGLLLKYLVMPAVKLLLGQL